MPTNNPQTLFEWLQVLGSAPTWIIILIGWIVVNWQNDSRETRKEIRAKLDFIQKLIAEIEDDAYHYHTDSNNSALARKIKRKIESAFGLISEISPFFSSTPTFEMAQFRRSVTLRNFANHDYRQLTENDEILDDIGHAAFDLARALEKQYSQKYHSAWFLIKR